MDIFHPSIKVETLKRSLIKRFVLLLSVFMMLLVTSYSFADFTISAKKHDALLINTAARQRSLIRQYASEISLTLIRLATSDLKMAVKEKKNADSTAKLFEEIIKSLSEGGKITVTNGWINHREGNDNKISLLNENIIIPKTHDSEMLLHLNHANDEWLELKRIAMLSLRSNIHSMSDSPYIKQLHEQSAKAVVQMDHVVQLMQYESEEKLKQLDQLLLSMIIIGCFLFVMLIYFVRFNIVNPLGSTIESLRDTTKNLQVEKLRAERASAIKSDFLSSMSHELRTPMNAIMGFGQMLELDSENFTRIQRGNINEILTASHHLMTLINEVLDLAKIESGNIKVENETVSLDALVPECISLVQPLAESREIKIIDNVSNNGDLVQADFIRLKQVLVNLLSNATKYNKENGLITLDREFVNKHYIRIKISDNGSGIPKEHIDKLFTPFERLDKENNIEGTGIGLAVSKNLVQLMGGKIGVESTVNKGSTFWVEMAV